MKILGLIPARGGSKGVPGKNIKLLDGKPLLAWTAEIAMRSELLDTVILSSDDAGIIAVAESIGLEVPFVRPKGIAQDNTPSIAVLQHALEYFEQQNEFFDAVCLLQVTSPFRSVGFLDGAIRKFTENNYDSLVSVQKVPHEYNPHWTFETDESGCLKIATGEKEIIARRQELPEAFHRDGSIYIMKSHVIRDQNSLYGKSIGFIESPAEWYVNIDTPEDWEKAEKLSQKLKKNL